MTKPNVLINKQLKHLYETVKLTSTPNFTLNPLKPVFISLFSPDRCFSHLLSFVLSDGSQVLREPSLAPLLDTWGGKSTVELMEEMFPNSRRADKTPEPLGDPTCPDER